MTLFSLSFSLLHGGSICKDDVTRPLKSEAGFSVFETAMETDRFSLTHLFSFFYKKRMESPLRRLQNRLIINI